MSLGAQQRNPPNMWGLASCQEGEPQAGAMAELAGAKEHKTSSLMPSGQGEVRHGITQ